MYQLLYKQSLRKDLRKIDKIQLRAIITRIEALANDPRPKGCVRLQGNESLYRIRQGEYRIIYCIEDDVLTVLVIKVAHRREVYRRV